MATMRVSASDGGQFSAYVAKPKAEKAPAILLIQEIFGVNKVMRDLADGYAAQGYLVACPDLFWRQEPGIDITDQTDAEWQKAFQLFKGFDVDKGAEDLKATLKALRQHENAAGKVGAVGYCLGGKLAYLMATRSDADAAVGYYGVGIENDLAEASRIAKPLMLHIAEKDQFVPAEAQAKVKKALASNPRVTIHSYPGQDHAFARQGGKHFNKEAADLANRRTAEFFAKHLKA